MPEKLPLRLFEWGCPVPLERDHTILGGRFIGREDQPDRLEVVFAGRFRLLGPTYPGQHIGVTGDDARMDDIVGRVAQP